MSQAVLLTVTLLIFAAPVMALLHCGESHFHCCGSSPETTADACVIATYCDDTKAERQEAPDGQLLSGIARRDWVTSSALASMSNTPSFFRGPLELQVTDAQPRLCTFLI